MAPVRTLIADDHAAPGSSSGRSWSSMSKSSARPAAPSKGWRRVERLAPDLVVLDARLPGVDGFAAAPRFVERGVAVVLCSALVDEAVRQRAAAAGVAAVASKDRLVEELAAAVLRAGRL